MAAASKKRAFPKDLAAVVLTRWENICGGDYVTPPCPPKRLLRELLEVAYLTANTPEEGRFPKFNVVAFEATDTNQGKQIVKNWKFETARTFSVDELRRLVPVIDINKSAVIVEWGTEGWKISGIADLGTSWFRARMGLGYSYQHPSCLFIQIDRPGRVRVYQGAFHVATLTDGEIESGGVTLHLFLHRPTISALEVISSRIRSPGIENPKDSTEFEFSSLWNTYAAIANCISASGHGGTVIIVPAGDTSNSEHVRLKYPTKSAILQDTFVDFLNFCVTSSVT